MELYAVIKDGNFVRGRGKSPHIRTYSSGARAEAYARRYIMGKFQVIKFVPQDVHLRTDPFTWSWDELENHLEIFDHVEVNFSDGGEHIPFSGDSGVTVLRVRDVTPQKQAGGKTLLHIGTDSNWFGKGRHRVLSDVYIEHIIEEHTRHNFTLEQKDKLLMAFGIGVPPVGEPTISTIGGA